MQAEHTPGPWTFEDSGRDMILILTERESIRVAEVVTDNVDSDKYAIADARLIAAAPDLLAALEEAMEFLDWAVGTEAAGEHIEAARAAIAKARGEAVTSGDVQ